MPIPLVILNTLPSPEEFYETYWNQVPFVVRGAIPEETQQHLISADELAGLAMEEAPMSRMVRTAGPAQAWSCSFGPFSEDDFATTGDRNWSFLVQNVEQFHPPTATLLRHFAFAPRWLMDDIMVSYSEPGGSVGPHIDSYHVFLVQGEGKRRWKIGTAALTEEIYIEDLNMKVLQSSFEGNTVELTSGDVLYLPPKFPHEGITTETSLTFSVGFLGPKLSELYGNYAHYLDEREESDLRYVGKGLQTDSAGFAISRSAHDNIQDHLIQGLKSKNFSHWLASFFTESSHEDLGNFDERDDILTLNDFQQKIKLGEELRKPEYVKFALTASTTGEIFLGFEGQSFPVDAALLPLIQKLMREDVISSQFDSQVFVNPTNHSFLLNLYNHQALEFTQS